MKGRDRLGNEKNKGFEFQVIESLPQTAVDVEMMDTEQQLPLVKILEWDSGKYLIL